MIIMCKLSHKIKYIKKSSYTLEMCNIKTE